MVRKFHIIKKKYMYITIFFKLPVSKCSIYYNKMPLNSCHWKETATNLFFVYIDWGKHSLPLLRIAGGFTLDWQYCFVTGEKYHFRHELPYRNISWSWSWEPGGGEYILMAPSKWLNCTLLLYSAVQYSSTALYCHYISAIQCTVIMASLLSSINCWD